MATVAKSGDSAGGAITGSGFVVIDGTAVVIVGDSISSHGDSPHGSATMSAGSLVVSIDGVALCRTDDSATCGHTATGTSHVSAD